ncbi:MAG TPA: hypothetical protein VMX54_13760 [Vicinamibacteria bacterium]|nr:hypothetical protein [Vicinamibacteria bacterium]
MADEQTPFLDLRPVDGGFSIPELKWRELLFVGALRPDGEAFVRDPSRPLPPFAGGDPFPAGVRFRVSRRGERVVVRREGAAPGFPV